MKYLARLLVLMLVTATTHAESTSPNESTASESIYQLNVALTSHANQAIKLDVYRGQPTLVTMFYGSCPNVCPLLIETLQSIEKSLGEKDRNRLRVLMVSIDPDRDTPAALTTVAKNHRVDLSRWTLARTSAADVRKIAAVLNVQYRKLPNGEYNHSSVITLLDVGGRPIAHTSRLGAKDEDFVKALKLLIAK